MPICELCGKHHNGMYGSGRFCSSFCAHSKSGTKTKEIREKISKGLNAYHIKTNTVKKPRLCKCCGKPNCKNPICHSAFMNGNGIKTLIKLGFNINTFGSSKVFNEYKRIQKQLKIDYLIKKLSYNEICAKYNIASSRTITLLLNFFKIKRRSFSEAIRLSYAKGTLKLSKTTLNNISKTKFKHGYHTDWLGNIHFYRSSLEEFVMKKLDDKKYIYKTEALNIRYLDSVKNTYRCAFPDIFLPEFNIIIEIKSYYTYNQQNMIDKAKAYRKLGYTFYLYINNKLYKRCIKNPMNQCLK